MLKYNRQFIIFVILLCFGQTAIMAQETVDISLFDSELSLFYQRGEVLIYDCSEKHWVCSGVLEAKRCEMKRKSSILDNDDILPCAVVDKFKNHKECVKEQRDLVNMNMGNRFCMHPKLREQYRSY